MGLLGNENGRMHDVQNGENQNRRARVGGSRGSYPDGSWREQYELYVVRKGDTLHSIAWRAYGDGTCWPRIQQANPVALASPDVIHPGLVIRIPKESGKPLA
jgi:nucleoid-associated protein YgaU